MKIQKNNSVLLLSETFDLGLEANYNKFKAREAM